MSFARLKHHRASITTARHTVSARRLYTIPPCILANAGAPGADAALSPGRVSPHASAIACTFADAARRLCALKTPPITVVRELVDWVVASRALAHRELEGIISSGVPYWWRRPSLRRCPEPTRADADASAVAHRRHPAIFTRAQIGPLEALLINGHLAGSTALTWRMVLRS